MKQKKCGNLQTDGRTDTRHLIRSSGDDVKIGHRSIVEAIERKKCTNFRKDWVADEGWEGISIF